MKKVVLLVMAVVFGLSVFAQGRQKGAPAKSVLGQKAPALVVEEWISEKPDTKGKFVMIDFWSTSCNPCRAMIPELNEWSQKFKEDLVIIGISTEKAKKVKAMKGQTIEYYNGVDTKKTMCNEVELVSRPYVLIVDPEGIVRWEGSPSNNRLTAEILENLIKENKGNKAPQNAGATQTKTIKMTVKSKEELQNLLKAFTGGTGGVKAEVHKIEGDSVKKVTVEKKAEPIQRQPWWGKSIINQKAPELHADRWITEKPDTKGKFMLWHFWSTLCGPCLKSIPKLNEFSKQFKDDLVVIGIGSDDSVERMKGKAVIEYYRAVDLKSLTKKPLDCHVLSYVLLIDPQGIVRLEDISQNLTAERIEQIIKQYKK